MAEGSGKDGVASWEAPERYQGLPVATAARMRSLDARAVQECGIPVLSLMENAGKAVAEATLDWLGSSARTSRLVIVCGRGNNGGDGLVAARYLKGKTAGLDVFLAEAGKKPYGAEVARNLERLRDAGVPVVVGADASALDAALARCTCVLDAVLGTGFTGEPRDTARLLIEAIIRCGKPVVAVDLPSGLDADTGEALGPCVRAQRTLTLGLAKRGLFAPRAREFAGVIEVLDIGFPAKLIMEDAGRTP